MKDNPYAAVQRGRMRDLLATAPFLFGRAYAKQMYDCVGVIVVSGRAPSPTGAKTVR